MSVCVLVDSWPLSGGLEPQCKEAGSLGGRGTHPNLLSLLQPAGPWGWLLWDTEKSGTKPRQQPRLAMVKPAVKMYTPKGNTDQSET